MFQSIVSKEKSTLHATWGLQGLLVLGYGLVFGGYLQHLKSVSEAIDPVTKQINAMRAAMADQNALFYTPPIKRPDFTDVMYTTGHLESGNYNMVVAGTVISTIAAIALLAMYKGVQRGRWIGMFVAVSLAQAAGLYLSKVVEDPLDVNNSIEDSKAFRSKGLVYLATLGISTLLMVGFTISIKMFDRHGKALRILLKLVFLIGYYLTATAYALGVHEVVCWKMFDLSVSVIKSGFSTVMVLGAYVISSEALAAVRPVETPVVTNGFVVTDEQKITTY